MNISFDLIQDKVEFFEADRLQILEKKIEEQIEHNKAIMLGVHSVQHQVAIDDNGRRYYTAAVHFKVNK
ncbi:hypothetical protein AS034_05980 [[Bacillus] enclensis]|uniref:DUF2536 domain-containing protein n=1 Tax=[Bacillus] enclensis TaxID=1402860 RepID=A0A0V8HMK5_9BACI|nr:DUF2536 family protein [[Bacillus] enclensis]KSU63790.1 hypothetical protein AS034_05980 [[Bacillus] enclensis]SCB89874.1 Protein of unknown function [[Bacillus] enclensis]